MIPLDPVDLTSALPFDAISYYSHIGIGLLAWLAALIALMSGKGGTWHRRAGWAFIGTVAIVCISAFSLLLTRFAPPLFLAALVTPYAVATAWLALQRPSETILLLEKALFGFLFLVAVLFIAMAVPAIATGQVPAFGPAVILIIPAILLAGDINWFRRPAERSGLRVRRHLARMIWALVYVVRAPLVEFYADLGWPLPVFLFGPIVAGVALIWYFRSRLPAARAASRT